MHTNLGHQAPKATVDGKSDAAGLPMPPSLNYTICALLAVTDMWSALFDLGVHLTSNR